MVRTRKTKSEIAAYYREYRKNASAEKKLLWSQQSQVRYLRMKNKAIAMKAKIARSERNRRDYQKRCAKREIPTTPNSKIKLLNSILDTASPSTAEKFAEVGLYSSRERKARDEIVNAANKVWKRDPSVRKALVNELNQSPDVNKSAVSEVLGMSRSHFNYKSTKGKNPRTSNATMELVTDFYKRPDISIQYPNKNKNYTVLRQSKKKTFKLFKEDFPNIKMSASTFYRLKPKGVKLMRAAKYLQCLCDICDSISMMIRSVKLSFVSLGMIVPLALLPGNETDLASHTVCDMKSLECLRRECSVCSNPKKAVRELLGDWARVKEAPVTYTVWEKILENVKGKDVSKMRKVTKTETRSKFIKALCKRLVGYPLHMVNAMSQLSAYKKCKQGLKPGQAVCVIDFAENYVCRQYKESQTTYYTRNSVTIHPMVLIFPESNAVKRDSVVCISDDLQHDAMAVQSFFNILKVHIQVHYPTLKHLTVWSDGCTAQYKSKEPLYNLSKSMGLPCDVTWNFYGSRHGKSESDGESGVVKTYLDTIVKADQHTLNTAKDVYQLLTDSDRNITDGPSRRHFYFMKGSTIDCMRKQMKTVPKPLPGVRSLHMVKPNKAGTGVMYRPISCYCTDWCWHPQSWKEHTFRLG